MPDMGVRIAANLTEFKKNLAEGRQQIEITSGAIQKMTKSFDGSKVSREAATMVQAVKNIQGGVGALNEKELARFTRTLDEAIDKQHRLGQQAPADWMKIRAEAGKAADAFGTVNAPLATTPSLLSRIGPMVVGAFSVGAIIGFAKSLAATADEVVRVSGRLGDTTDAVQELRYIGDQTSVSLDAMTSAIGQMQNRLASGDASAVGAVKALKLELSDIERMSPSQQFYALGEAIGKIEDPATRTQLAMDLFGKSGAQVLPAMVENMRNLAAEAPKMSAAAISAYDAIGDSISRMWTKSKTAVGEGIATAISAYSRLYTAIKQGGTGQVQAALTTLTNLNLEIRKTPEIALRTNDAYHDMSLGEAELASITRDLDTRLRASREGFKASGDGAKQAAADLEQFTSAVDRADTTMRVAVSADIRSEIDAFYAAVQQGAKTGATSAIEFAASVKNLGGVITSLPAVPESLAGMGDQLEEGAKDWRTYADKTAQVFDAVSRSAEMMGHRTTAAVASIASAVVSGFATGGWWGAAIAGIMATISAVAGSGSKAMTAAEQLKSMQEGNARVMEEQIALLEKYGLTWQNMGWDNMSAQWYHMTQALIADIQTLQTYGVTADDIVRGTAKSLNQLLADSLATGQAIPASLQPLISRLVEMGLITDENAAKLLGYSTTAQAEYDKITANIQKNLDTLKTEYDTLASSIKDEAPEEVMGIIETQTRARMEQIEAEKKALDEQMKQAVDAGKKSQVDVIAQAEEINKKLREFFEKPIHVPVEFDVTYPPGWPVPPAPGSPSPPGEEPPRQHQGGLVLHSGGAIDAAITRALHGLPTAHRGLSLDEVPIIGLRGEYMVSRTGVQAYGRSGMDAINQGRVPPAIGASNAAMEAELKGLRRDLSMLPRLLRDVILTTVR